MIAIRWMSSLLLAALLTLLLFLIMQSLIASGALIEQQSSIVKVVDATMPEIEMEVIVQVIKPEPIEPLDATPPPIQERVFRESSGINTPVTHVQVSDPTLAEIDNSTFLISDGEMMPLVNVLPTYPNRALQNRIEGWAQVRFTVTETGNVRDVEIVDAVPERIFDRSSIQAAEKFRYQPRVVDGIAVEVPNVQYVFRYELDDEQ